MNKTLFIFCWHVSDNRIKRFLRRNGMEQCDKGICKGRKGKKDEDNPLMEKQTEGRKKRDHLIKVFSPELNEKCK